MRDIGGWRADVADAQHDLLLRLMRIAEPRAVVHLAKLAHRRNRFRAVRPESRARNSRSSRRASRSSIPTRDGADVLATCIRSIRSRTRYPDYEIIIVDNGSVQDRTKRLFAEFAADPAIKNFAAPRPFNFRA